MSGAPISGAEGYAAEAEDLLRRYERMSFADVHRSVLHLMPAAPSRVLDIGAGTGRDAAAFAEQGHRVVAVEPTRELRLAARELHPSPTIEWVDDCLPELASLRTRAGTFDLVMLTAVWMHLDESQRRSAMPKVAELAGSGAHLIMSLRHGPVPPGRRMFEVTAEETIELAQQQGLSILQRSRGPGLGLQKGVSWTSLAFVKSM